VKQEFFRNKRIGVEPHYLTDESLEAMFKKVAAYKENIRNDVIFRGVKW